MIETPNKEVLLYLNKNSKSEKVDNSVNNTMYLPALVK